MKTAITVILLMAGAMKIADAMRVERAPCAADFLIRGHQFDRCVTEPRQ